MPDPRVSYRAPYFDSSVWIAWVMGEVIDGVNRADIARHLLVVAQSGVFKIHTSTWTMAEVHKKRHFRLLETEQDQTILRFFEQEFIALIELDREIGERANQIARDFGIAPGDAVHRATAIRAECDVVLAWDGPLTGRTDLPIPVEEPRMLGQLTLPLDRTPDT
ncbi:MAG: PIN domain-containing protein [Chloroflexota bacterium]|nr:MAG: PIN domain-containing protein [Chloroflexota bacterium]